MDPLNFGLRQSFLVFVASSFLLRLSSHFQQFTFRLWNHSCWFLAELLIHPIILLKAISKSPFPLFLLVLHIVFMLSTGSTNPFSIAACLLAGIGDRHWGTVFASGMKFFRSSLSSPCCTSLLVVVLRENLVDSGWLELQLNPQLLSLWSTPQFALRQELLLVLSIGKGEN